MAAKTDLNLLKELFEAHLGPIRRDIQEIKDGQKDGAEKTEKAKDRADDAHSRIDGWENKGWGVLAGLGGLSLGSGGIGAILTKWLWIGSH